MWAAIAISLIMSAISYALMPKPPKPQNAVVGEVKIPEPPKGKPVPVVFGTVWIKNPGVIYYGNKRTEAIKSEKVGKK